MLMIIICHITENLPIIFCLFRLIKVQKQFNTCYTLINSNKPQMLNLNVTVIFLFVVL